MDIFKIQLDRAIKKGKLETFMLNKGKKDKEKIKNYSNYIIKNSHTYDWLSSYFLVYDGEELLEAIIDNYAKIKETLYDMHYIIKKICTFPAEKAIVYLDKLVPKLESYDIRELMEETKDKDEILIHIIDKYIIYKDIGFDLVESLLREKIYTNKVYENINSIIENNPNDLFKLLKINELPEEIKTKIKKTIAHSEDYLEETVQTILKDIYQLSYTKERLKVGSDTIKILIKEICQNENKDYGDIQYLGAGTFSHVLGIGNKVLKIGSIRATKTFPNNPFIITPLMRETIDIDNHSSIFLEVTEKVETDIEITDEELYNLYKNLRETGLVWTDMAWRNVGRLTKDNIVHWNTKLEPTNESLELQEKRGDIVLKKGSLVILDADHIYDEKTEEAQKKLSSSKYEKRYQKELERKNKQKHYPLNELLDCRITNNTLHIHVVPKSVKEDIEQMGYRQYLEYANERLDNALSEVYNIITTQEQNIQNIFAISPLLSHLTIKKMFEKQGFNTSITPDKKFEEMFPGQKIGQAIIKRDDFIQIQKQKQENKTKPKVKTLTKPNNQGYINSILITSVITIITILLTIILIKK